MKTEYIGKCLFIEGEKKILVVGDLHLGYEEVLNQAGIFLTRKMFEESIKYFDLIFDKIGKIDYIILLGDVKHNFGNILKQERNEVLGIFDYLSTKLNKDGRLIITKGNHDNILEPIVKKRESVEIRDYFILDSFVFLHGDRDFPVIYDKKIKYWIMGHGHPAVKLSDGVKIENYKCFLTGKFHGRKIIIVPSFFEYVEGSDPRETDLKMAWDLNLEKFNAWIVGDNKLEVLDFGELGKL